MKHRSYPSIHLVEVYDCGLMAAFCDSCLLLPEQFRCVWCEMSSVDGVGSGGGNVSSGSCVHMDRCTAQTALATDGVRGRGQMHTSLALCPNPRILQVPLQLLRFSREGERERKMPFHFQTSMSIQHPLVNGDVI